MAQVILLGIVSNKKFCITQSRLEVTKGWEEGEMWNYYLMGIECLFWVM